MRIGCERFYAMPMPDQPHRAGMIAELHLMILKGRKDIA